jgi:LacI family transcriptional regulator, galactose operon repressor
MLNRSHGQLCAECYFVPETGSCRTASAPMLNRGRQAVAGSVGLGEADICGLDAGGGVRAAHGRRGGGDRQPQAALDRPAVVQAQDDAGGEGVARAYGAADLRARQPETDEELVNCECPTSQAAADAVSALLGGSRPPTAILSATTRASLGVVPALHSARRTDIGLVSFGDFPMADALRPAVTVVDHPGHEVGRVAAARLLARLDQPDLPVERIGVPARLIQRGSGEQRP